MRFRSLCAISSFASPTVGFGHVTKYVHSPGGGVTTVRGGRPRRMARVPSIMASGQGQLLNARIRARFGTNMKHHSSQHVARRRRANAIVCFISNDTIHTNPMTKTKWCLTRIHISSQISSAVLSATRLPDLSLSLAFVIGNAPVDKISW